VNTTHKKQGEEMQLDAPNQKKRAEETGFQDIVVDSVFRSTRWTDLEKES
jgi:hypothetical protein